MADPDDQLIEIRHCKTGGIPIIRLGSLPTGGQFIEHFVTGECVGLPLGEFPWKLKFNDEFGYVQAKASASKWVNTLLTTSLWWSKTSGYLVQTVAPESADGPYVNRKCCSAEFTLGLTWSNLEWGSGGMEECDV